MLPAEGDLIKFLKVSLSVFKDFVLFSKYFKCRKPQNLVYNPILKITYLHTGFNSITAVIGVNKLSYLKSCQQNCHRFAKLQISINQSTKFCIKIFNRILQILKYNLFSFYSLLMLRYKVFSREKQKLE